MSLAPMNPFMGEQIKSDAEPVVNKWAQMAHIQIAAADATLGVANSVHAAKNCPEINVPAHVVLHAATAITDILTITSENNLGAATNGIPVDLVTAAGDALAVTEAPAGTLKIALANTTAAKNTGALITAAINGLTTVGGIDVTNMVAAPGGNWNIAAIATGETGVVPFAGGQMKVDIITTNLHDPKIPRSITATAGGVGADIGAVAVTVYGTNANDEAISEVLPAFTLNTAGIVKGALAFKTIQEVDIPAHDGLGATTAIGDGDKIGLNYKLARDTIAVAYFDNSSDMPPTSVTIDDTDLEKNVIQMKSALNAKQLDIYLMVD